MELVIYHHTLQDNEFLIHVISTHSSIFFQCSRFPQMVSSTSSAIGFFCLVSLLAIFCLKSRPKRIYMVDFACIKPDSASICTKQRSIETLESFGYFSKENLEFMKKVMDKSGLGEKTHVPESLLQDPPNLCLEEARKETETVIFGAIDELLAKSGVNANDIGILVVNCTVFNPTPSISAMVVNHYKMSEDILSYNLGGMGCSAGLVSIDLAERLLQVYTIDH